MVVAWIWDLKQSIEGAMTACDGKVFQIRIEEEEEEETTALFSEGKHNRISNVLAGGDSDNSRALVPIQTTAPALTNVS
jgi:hypothetical protein